MFEAIKQFIINFDAYISDNIFQNYPNDTCMPDDNNFVVMTKLYSKPYCALVQKFLTPDPITKTVKSTANQLQATYFQVDFYGDLSSDFADKFSVAMQCGFANEFFISNNYPFTIKSVEAPIQLTHSMDKEQYIDKFAVRFALENNVITDNTVDGTDAANINGRLVETIKL